MISTVCIFMTSTVCVVGHIAIFSLDINRQAWMHPSIPSLSPVLAPQLIDLWRLQVYQGYRHRTAR